MRNAEPEALAYAPDDEAAWQRLARGYRLAGLLLSAHRLGLLQRLAKAQATLDALARDLQADEAIIEQMCRALDAAGLLRSGDAGWRLTDAGRRMVSDPAAAAELDSLAVDYQRWGCLDVVAQERARQGGADDPRTADVSRADVASARRYALRLAARHRAQAVALLDRLDPTRPLRLLDVGGADGFLTREVCDRWPDAECVVLEQPSMAEVARRACRDYDRISVVEGHFLNGAEGEHLDALPGPADVVVLSHVLQGSPETAQRGLTARAAAALQPGGCVLSCESVLRSDQRGPLDTVLWAVGQASLGRSGNMLTTLDQDILLRASGLAACGAWWVSDSTRAVIGVRPDAGVTPALLIKGNA